MTGLYLSTFTGAQVDSALANVLTTKLTRSATLVVAASNSSAKSKAQADYVCDGTNDLSIINTALAQGGVVFLHDGTYTKTDTTQITIPSNTCLKMSSNTVLKFADGLAIENPKMILASNVENISIEGGIIDGNKSTSSATGIQAMGIAFVSVNKSRISGVRIKDVGTTQSNSGYGIYLNSSSENTIQSCVISGCKRENLVLFESSNYNTVTNIHSSGSDDRGFVIHRSEYNIISKCTSSLDAVAGIDIQPYTEPLANSKGNIISGNVITGSAIGIKFNGSSGASVTNNSIYTMSNCGIQFGDTYNNDDCVCDSNTIVSCATGIKVYSGKNKISNNVIKNQTGTSTNSTAGILCNGSYAIISDNLIDTCVSIGILVVNSVAQSNINVRGNSIYNCNGTGISVQGYTSNVAINNNILSNNALSAAGGFINGITIYAPNEAGKNDRVMIDGNIIYRGAGPQDYGIRVHTYNTNLWIRNNLMDLAGDTSAIRDDTTSAVLLNNI